jgi:hypothetical protein
MDDVVSAAFLYNPSQHGDTTPPHHDDIRARCPARRAAATSACTRSSLYTAVMSCSSASSSAAEEAASPGDDGCAFLSLPQCLVLEILARVPVDTRLRCSEVCRGWRDALADSRLWTTLNLRSSASSSLRGTADAVLRAAAARAGGALSSLDVSVCSGITFHALLAVVRANERALRHLCVCWGDDFREPYAHGTLDVAALTALLHAAPRLDVLEADAHCSRRYAEAQALLRREGVFRPLHVRTLEVSQGCARPRVAEAEVLSVAAGVVAHASVTALKLRSAPLDGPVALDAVVDAAVACGVAAVTLCYCALSPSSVPALSRLFNSRALTRLCIYGNGQPLLDAHAAETFGDALRDSSITSLTLNNTCFWSSRGVPATLLGALVGHGSLQKLALVIECGFHTQLPGDERQREAGAALSALVAANASALHELDVADARLTQEALGPMLDALPHNTHLRVLRCDWRNNSPSSPHMWDAFVRQRLLPAVRANRSLHTMHTHYLNDDDVQRQVDDALASRTPHGGT